MKKRLFSLLLCLLMVVPTIIMAGCSSDEDEEIQADMSQATKTKAVTLTLYSITSEDTSEEAVALVQDAINKITETEFNTHVILRLYPEAEYEQIIQEKIVAIEEQLKTEEAWEAARKAAQKAAKAAGVTTAPATTDDETTVDTEETELNEYGMPVTVYPEEDGDQLDIFLINSLEMYQDCFDAGVLTPLDEELSVNSKILRNYIAPTLMNYAKIEGATYAIPNNHTVGDYQFLLINRELADKYYFDAEAMTSLTGTEFKDYIQLMAAKEPGYVTMLNSVDLPLYYPDGNGPSVLGAYAVDAPSIQMGTPRNLFSARQYKNNMALLLDYKKDGIIVEGEMEADGKYAAAVVTGDYSIKEQYEEDYYVITYRKPAYTNEEVFGSMYAVGTYTKSVSRCMEIITYLTTNEELRNVFQYGAEGVHYTRDEDSGMVSIISDEYKMNPLHTGNLFKLWANDQMTEAELAMAANSWEVGKEHNLNYAISPYLGFSMYYEDKEIEIEEDEEGVGEVPMYFTIQEMVDGLAELNESIFKKLAAYNGTQKNEDGEIMDAGEYIDMLADEIDGNEYFNEAINKDNINSPVGQYSAWYSANYATE